MLREVWTKITKITTKDDVKQNPLLPYELKTKIEST